MVGFLLICLPPTKGFCIWVFFFGECFPLGSLKENQQENKTSIFGVQAYVKKRDPFGRLICWIHGVAGPDQPLWQYQSHPLSGR